MNKVTVHSIDQLATFMGLPPKAFDTRTFATYHRNTENLEAYQACQQFLNPTQRQHFFLTLSGKCGRGKSHLAIATAIYYIMQSDKLNVKYYQAETLMDELRSKFDQKPGEGFTYDKLMHFVKGVDLLVIDDFGAHKNSEWAEAKMDEIIDDRYLNERLTMVTTNLPADKMPPRIASRLREGVVVVMAGEDYRLKKGRS